MMGACGVFIMRYVSSRYVSSFFCLHRTGWFRRFLVANTFPAGASRTCRAACECPRWFTVPEVLHGVMRPDPSPDSLADEHPGFSSASRPDENLREQLSRLMPKLPDDGSLPPANHPCAPHSRT